MTQDAYDIVIVGGGFSGTMVAANLLRLANVALKIALVERLPAQFARGVAYRAAEDCHLLNVPAANMSAFPDDPGHFLAWAQARAGSITDTAWVPHVGGSFFLPRRVYGDYLRWVLDQAEGSAASGVTLDRRFEDVIGIDVAADGVALRTSAGGRLFARKAVLALGNFPPRDPAVNNPEFYRSRNYVSYPWDSDALNSVLATDACLLIGTGLTMVDWTLALNRAGYRGTIHALSRRGLAPTLHRPGPPLSPDAEFLSNAHSIRRMVHRVRSRIAELSGDEGADWRSVIDGLRPYNQEIWRRLPLDERRRFLRHVRQFWDTHRHRLAPEVGQAYEALAAAGRLVRHVGRLVEYRKGQGGRVEVVYRPRGKTGLESISVGAVVNCSGSESDYRKLDSPLVRSLLEQGLARSDPLFLGLDVDASGALLNADGRASSTLFTLGPPAKGILWETTAVPEIRVQADRLARNAVTGAPRP